MSCKKCQGDSTIVLRKKDPYCDTCFLANTNHKFRACIGKNKILCTNEKVLICLSGGKGSTVMLDLIYSGISMDIHRKLRINPFFIHLIDTKIDSYLKVATNVIDQCKKYNFNVYIASVSEYLYEKTELPEMNCIPIIDEEAENQYRALLNSMPATTSNDLKQKINRKLFIKFAHLLECNFIFTGETMSVLATNLLSNLAMGRGSQVEHDIGFCDNRNKSYKILRPMKDISTDELNHYIKIKKLISVDNEHIKGNSLQSVIATFVTDLQENFQSTISTVCKTADKIGIHNYNENEQRCVICDSNLGMEDLKLSALNGTNISRTVSFSRSSMGAKFENFQDQILDESMFPYFEKHLCYSCSRNYSEMDKSKLPNHLIDLE